VSADLVRLVDDLESRAAGYVTLAEVESAAGRSVAPEIASAVLLVDYRDRIAPDGTSTPVTLCRLNRRHPLVRQLTAW
jgi:hypothetical protein